MVLLSVLSNILASLEPFTKVCIIYMCYFNSLFETLFYVFHGLRKKETDNTLSLSRVQKLSYDFPLFNYAPMFNLFTFRSSRMKNLPNFLNFIL